MSNFAHQYLAFNPDPLQSTVLAVKAAHRAYTRVGSLTLVGSPSVRQSAEFLRKTAEFLRRLAIPRRGTPYTHLPAPFGRQTAPSLIFLDSPPGR